VLLELRDVNVYYGMIHALRNISMRVNDAMVVTMIGGNGAGKSTTIKTISGLVRPSSGQIYYGGEQIENLSVVSRVERGIVHVPEGRRIFPDLTVKENLNMGAYTRKDKFEVIRDFEKMLSMFPILSQRSSQKGGSMSGGEQQMLAVARGLMAKPRLLLLDEPSLGLAPLVVLEIGKIVTKVHENGTAILLVEQNANMALKISNIAYVIETGEIVLQGKSEIIREDQRVKEAYLGK
jgi:branched-chain amino acid transport system ATP-binding protein